MAKYQPPINSDLLILNQREFARKERELENRIIPQVILDSHTILDAILKIKGKDLALKYEIVVLSIQKKIRGVITTKTLEEIEEKFSLCLDSLEKTSSVYQKIRKSMILWKSQKSSKSTQIHYGYYSDRLRIENYIRCASATKTKTIISALPKDDFKTVARELKTKTAIDIDININVVNPQDFLTWFDTDENERCSLDKFRLFNSDEIAQLNNNNEQVLVSKSCQDIREELIDSYGVSFTDSQDEQIVIKIGDYTLENYEIRSYQGGEAWGKVTLWNSRNKIKISEEAKSIGSIKAVCKALNQAMQTAYSDDTFLPQATHTFKLIANGQGLETKVRATAIVKHHDCLYLGVYEDQDSIKAALFAYARACAKFKNRMYSNSEAAGFYRADLSGVDISHVNLKEANFNEAILTSANLQKSIFQASSFREAILTQAKISNANLAHVVGDKARFAYADLSKTDLTKAIFYKTDFHKANLSEAILYCTQLNEANLTEADLTKVKFTGANLKEANLIGAKIDSGIMEASLDGAIMPNGRRYNVYPIINNFVEFEKKYIHKLHHALRY